MNINDQKLYLSKLLKSNAFKKSPTSARLLTFLANSTFDKVDLKETTIGLELFGNSFLNETNSSRIRVTIYNLRKKLDLYYKEEGREDLYRIDIKKGQYYISFNKNKGHEVIDYNKRYKLVLVFFFILLFGFVLTIIAFFHKPKIVLWDSFFRNDKEVVVVVGDLFGVEGKNLTGKTCWYRDYTINSIDDLYDFVRKNPVFKDNIKPSSYTYMTGMGPLAVNEISRLFNNQDSEISVKISSKLNYRDLKTLNVIYVGPLKNKNKMIDYFNQTSSKYSLFFDEKGVALKGGRKNALYRLSTETNDTEYAIVAKFYEENNGNSHFMFFSDHDIGVMSTVEYFTSPLELNNFSRTHNFNEYTSFIALYKVIGRERINLSLELIFVDTH